MPDEIKNDSPIQNFMRGEIYYIYEKPVTGSEQKGGRPAVIVSSDLFNDTSTVVEVCYLTLRRKPSLPTHVILTSGPCANSTILCEQITTVDVSRIGDYKCLIPEDQMEELDVALRVSLALGVTKKSNTDAKGASAYALTPTSVMDELNALKHENSELRDRLRLTEDARDTLKQAPAGLAKQLRVAESEADMYKRMYYELLDRLIDRGVK